jgi:hypothetical protein
MKFYQTCGRDIIHEGLRFDMVLTAFIAAKNKKTKPDSDKLY